MSATKRFERLYRFDNAKNFVKVFIFVVLPLLAISYFLTQNIPTNHLSTHTAIVTYIKSTSTNAETGGAGGQSVSHITVALASGYKTQLRVLYPPIPKKGDTVLVNKYKNKISGVRYLYGGIKTNEN